MDRQQVKGAFKWYWQTSALVGMPITLILLAIGIQRLAFTATCQLGGWRCEYSLGAKSAGDYIQGLMETDVESEVVVRPKKGKDY